MTAETLAQAIARAGGPVELLRNQNWPAVTFPIQAEFSNWRDEQRAWATSVAILDQSHHMTQLFLWGDDLVPLLASLSPNSFANFHKGMAKHLVTVNDGGFVVGDGILSYNHEGPEGIVLTGYHIQADWVRFNVRQAQAAGKDVQLRLEPNSNMRVGDPTFYRLQLQGPKADIVIEGMLGGPAPDLRLFHSAEVEIAGTRARAMRHGMAGQPGLEFYGPYGDGAAVLGAMLEAGTEFDIRRVGAKAYSTSPLASGWVPTPFPAIFGDDFADYREWLPAARAGSVGGSLYTTDVRDYYLTPFDIGLGHLVSFDHDFHGRQALERIADNPGRRKVRLEWNADDVAGIVQSQLEPGTPAKYLDFPKARYGLCQMDEIWHGKRRVGISTDAGYLAPDHAYVSLAALDVDVPEGAEVEIVWGEHPISHKPQVDQHHRQVRIRATVTPAPSRHEA